MVVDEYNFQGLLSPDPFIISPNSESKTLRKIGMTASAMTSLGKSLGLDYSDGDEASAKLVSIKRKFAPPRDSEKSVSAFGEVQNLNPR